MIEIDIKSKKYPITIKVSDIDFEAVSKECWHVSRKPTGQKRIDAMIFNGVSENKMQIMQYIFRRMYPTLEHKLYLVQKNDDEYDFTRGNIIREKEVKIVKKMIQIDEDKPDYKALSGNDFVNGLYANMKRREQW